MIGYLANQAVPRLGEVLKCTILARYEKVPAEKLIGTIILERLIDALTLLAIFVDLFVNNSLLRIIPIFGRIFRALALLRTFKQLKYLQRLMDTVVCAIPSLANIMIVLSLFLFMFAILASYFFANVTSDPYAIFN